MTRWTEFMDMHSGGGQKLDWAYIYIEAPLEEAKVIFYNRFGRNPDRVTCTCCGADYWVHEEDDIREPREADNVIHAADIKPEERAGSLPDEGYIWAGG